MSIEEVAFALQPNDVVGFTENQRTAVELSANISISVEPAVVYKNLKYPRDKCFYGYAQLMFGAFVVEEIPLNFLNQRLVHWRDYSFGINDTTVCMAKLIAGALPEPQVISGRVVKTRQAFTSIRFELCEATRANIVLKWENGESSCGNNVEQPSSEQGNPPEPANNTANPGSRPPGQGGDDFDNSPNDGRPKKPGEFDPPSPIPAGTAYGRWYQVVTWEDGYTQTYPMTDVSPTSNYQAVGKCYEGAQGVTGPTGKSGIGLFLNGNYIGCSEDIANHGNTTSVIFEYR